MHSVPRSSIRVLLAFSIFLLVSCGGGGNGDSSTAIADQSPTNISVGVESLSGNWFGTLEDPAGGLHLFSVTVDEVSITQILVDGVSNGLVGTLTKEAGQVFSVLLSDGSRAAFITDRTARYAAVVDEDFSFGVIQKGDSGLPLYTIDDVNGIWAGVTVLTNAVTFEQFASTANCASLLCTASAGNGVDAMADFTGSFNADFGRWTGSYSNTAGSVGTAVGLLSPDRQFAATYGCDLAGSFPESCDFTGWERQ